MVARRFFEHVTPGGSTLGDRVNATGYIAGRRDWELGEAIAWAQQPLDTPASLMRAWLASPATARSSSTAASATSGSASPPG